MMQGTTNTQMQALFASILVMSCYTDSLIGLIGFLTNFVLSSSANFDEYRYMTVLLQSIILLASNWPSFQDLCKPPLPFENFCEESINRVPLS